jgi:hypothetical protein
MEVLDMEEKNDHRRNARSEESDHRGTGKTLNSYLKDPWACYEDDESFCDTEAVEEHDCCCCG